MITNLLAIAAGFILLTWSADRFITGASATARNLNISPLIIGLTVVGFGTSVPEFIVAGFAAYGGNPGLAVGNALGSNITNIALVLGVTAILAPIQGHSTILHKALIVLCASTLLATLLLWWGNDLSLLDGVILIGAQFVILAWIVIWGKEMSDAPLLAEIIQEAPTEMTMARSIFLLLLGLIVLSVSSRLLVWGAVNIATDMGISDLVVGLTIVAIGTSLPELAASITAALKKEHDIVIGNIVGSNLFNTLAVLSTGGLIHPAPLAPFALERDMLIVCILTFLLAWQVREKVPSKAESNTREFKISKNEGVLLLAIFISYECILYLNTTGKWVWPILT